MYEDHLLVGYSIEETGDPDRVVLTYHGKEVAYFPIWSSTIRQIAKAAEDDHRRREIETLRGWVHRGPSNSWCAMAFNSLQKRYPSEYRRFLRDHSPRGSKG